MADQNATTAEDYAASVVRIVTGPGIARLGVRNLVKQAWEDGRRIGQSAAMRRLDVVVRDAYSRGYEDAKAGRQNRPNGVH